MSDFPKAPRHLRKAMAEWWDGIVVEWELETHHLRILQTACEAWDRMVQAREALAEHGLTFTDRFGQPRNRPELAVEA